MTSERRLLEERRDMARRDLQELAEQVEAGEIDAATAAELQAAYETDLDEASQALAGLPKAETSERVDGETPIRSNRRAVVGTVLVIAALSVAIFYAARDISPEDDGPPATVASEAPGALSVDPASVSNEQLEQVVAANPTINAMRLALADRYFEAQEYGKALEHYLFIAENQPTPAEEGRALSRVGWMAYITGQPDTAEQYVQTSLTVDPTNDEAKLFLGFILLYGLGDAEGAIPWLEDVAALTNLPDNIRAEVDQALADARGQGGG